MTDDLSENTPLAWPQVAHLLRPAQGGMRAQVRALLLAAPPEKRLLAAPLDVLEALSADVPLGDNRLALEVQGNAPTALVQAGRGAGRWAKAQGARVLHGHGLRWAPLFWSASMASGLPLVVTLHNLVPDDLSPPVRTAIQLALGRARRIIAVSEAVAESAARIVPADKVVVVYNGVDFGSFDSVDASPRDPAVPSTIVCVARLSAEKGIGTLLEAVALLRGRGFPEVRLIVAGEGAQRLRLEWQRSLLGLEGGGVELLGAVPGSHIPALLAAADILCVPSREEGLGLAAVEAMAAGLPVVATRVGGLPEVVVDGETGLLVSPRDPAALAEALAALLADPARSRQMGSAGRARAQAHFASPAMLLGTRAVYAQALAGRE